ncbi:MAG: aromatic hydrocarbon degradation protein [endosymbiont of Galathealinum brachiosum]|uniref:Aromatic hydrocarbon degradation protein n=1 Tax=endosymbiont of Galathealinum brachiosum TaxID=2200906 RepID=A0A370DKJ1_9GAMM|nr:MAG: aromatic hydrocarbon degradation protein [endosymbiont of Galathealinum brachiosum]
MNNKILAACTVVTTVFSNNVVATNGDSLIGLGAISRAMGGTGIAHFAGAESALKNPAILAKQEGLEVMFGGTFFAPDVEVTKNGSPQDMTAVSDAKENMIPEVAIAHTLGDGWVIGVGMFGSAGMGTDWRDSAPMLDPTTGQVGLYGMRSNLLLLKFAVPVAYGQDNWSIGFAPVMQYGALDLAFTTSNTDQFGAFNTPNTKQVGQGSSYDFGMGYDLGFAYEIPDAGITLGLVYESAIGMTYDHQISNAASAFGYGTPGALPNFSDDLEQPAHIGFGIDWNSNDLMSVTFDVKSIKWGEAEGYKDFGWENQTVYALGVEYIIDRLALRFGYNYGKNPIENSVDTTPVFAAPSAPTNGDVLNTFNHIMFPAITEQHFTAGFGYTFSKHVLLDMAFTFATSQDVTVSATTTGLGDLTVTNDQIAITAGIKYQF